MGPCQGRICGTASEFLFGWDAGSILSSVRPPLFPVRVSSLGHADTLADKGDGLASAGMLASKETE
jgi:hypothetical protein